MDRERAKQELQALLPEYVQRVTKKSKGSNMYICPICHSGEGRNGTGAFSIKDGTSWKCFSCGAGGDIFDLIGQLEGLKEFPEQLERAAEIYNIRIDPDSSKNRPQRENSARTTDKGEKKTGDFTEFFKAAHKDIYKTDYALKRGLSWETIKRFKLGYVPEWRHPKAPNAPASPRLIIPISAVSYTARDTRDNIPAEQEQYKKSKAKAAEGASWTFNAKALKTATKPIFIVEGELDALSIIEVGGEAIGIGSTAYIKAFIDLVKKDRPAQPLIIALDNDEAGEKATEELSEALNELGVLFYRYSPFEGYKDANEALTADREALSRAVAVDDIDGIEAELARRKKENYLKTSAANCLQAFMDGVSESANTPHISTGFENLDNELDGGLYQGLYILGAISSLGKSTFILQMADQIAQSGKDILIFSLEMSKYELMAKSISRHTMQLVLSNGGNINHAKTTRGITAGERYANYSDAEHDLICSALAAYNEYADHIFISEGIGDIGAAQIRAAVKKHKDITGNTPIVMVDYIQILAPYDVRATDKQIIDKAVLELKRISRDYNTPVIGISSFNRENYKEAVTMKAFKESGAIEYGCDVLIGLQLEGAGDKNFNETEAKKKNPRAVELVILKNRNGKTGAKLKYSYYPLFNCFYED